MRRLGRGFLPSQFPVTAARISHGSITRLTSVCAAIAGSRLRPAMTYTIANNPPRTVVEATTGTAILTSPLIMTQTV